MGRYDTQWFEQQAYGVQLPQRWITETTAEIAQNEARRASAQAARVDAESQTNIYHAEAAAARQAARASEKAGYAEADKIDRVLSSKLEEQRRRIENERVASDA